MSLFAAKTPANLFKREFSPSFVKNFEDIPDEFFLIRFRGDLEGFVRFSG